jgi:hypothetical protein
MEQFDENWIRWVVISYAKHVDLLRRDVPFYLEGFAPNPNDIKNKESYFELRIDGPYSKEMAKNQWNMYFEVNVLIAVHQDDNKSYRMQEMVGIANTFFTDASVMVRKYGTGPQDDQELLGFLQLNREKVKSSMFGKIRPDMRLMQATVEGHYDLYMD